MTKGNNEYSILPTAYFGPVQYYCRMALLNRVIIEQFDHYSRQTYRNRAVILGANGPVSLTVPVKKEGPGKKLVKDVLVDYATNWQKDHYRGIVSAYNSAPFFEFFFDDFEWVFNEKSKYLIDLNNKINARILKHLGADTEVQLSEKFIFNSEGPDLRDLISPKTKLKDDRNFHPKSYTQVFEDRHGFVPNLSVLDLLFCTGPEAIQILKKSFRYEKGFGEV